MRADRLLRGMHKVVRHDLPNQLVAVHALLALLDQEESPRLSETGREYVRRLQNAAQRASELTRFLAEMERISAIDVKNEPVFLDRLTRDLLEALRRRHAGWSWTADTHHFHHPVVPGDARVYQEALVELVSGSAAPTGDGRIHVQSSRRGDSVDVEIVVNAFAGPTPTEQRLEFLLAREWLSLCHATLDISIPVTGKIRFAVLVPNG
jgi:light-regulated signal transduction histidine kinase (bacteriophytochrome)